VDPADPTRRCHPTRRHEATRVGQGAYEAVAASEADRPTAGACCCVRGGGGAGERDPMVPDVTEEKEAIVR
jgi:hypothetical protein